MKIFIAHYSYRDDISGVTSWLHDFIDYFKHKHELFVYLRHNDRETSVSNFSSWLVQQGVDHIIVGKEQSVLEDTNRLLEVIKKQKPDIFFPQCIHSNFLAGVACGRIGLPWVFTMHSDDDDYWSFLKLFDPYETSGRIVSVSSFLGDKVKDYTKQKDPLVIPCGVQRTKEKASWNPTHFNLVYSGRLVVLQKRMDLVIESMIEVCKSNRIVTCTVIGDGSYKPVAENLVKEAGLSDRIIFTGMVERTEVYRILSNSQAFILLSEFEGLPVALMEAMEKGLVPIVRNIKSGIPELVEDGVTGYFTESDTSHVVNIVEKLSSDKLTWNKVSKAAIEKVTPHYLKDPNFEKWELVLDHLVSDNTYQNSDIDKISIHGMFIPDQYKKVENSSKLGLFERLKRKIRHVFS